MKNKLLLLMLAMAAAFTSCRSGDAGEPGPAGSDNLNKQGSISGTFNYSYYNEYTATNDTLILPFNFEYYESEQDNLYGYTVDPQSQAVVSHNYEFSRRSLKDNYDYMYITYNYGVPSGPIPSDFEIELGLSRILANNGVYGFGSYSNFNGSSDLSTLVISNYNFNASTGALIFDFVMEIDPYFNTYYGVNNYVSYRPKVTGHVDVVLRKNLNGSSQPTVK
ncbi:MAG: hypothetical protein U0U66_05115 [Cytophagaceae bacterium]